MHSLKVMWWSRRSGLLRPLFSNNHRDFSRLSESAAANDFDSVVLVEGEGCSRTAILNRPHVLNALNISMGARLQNLYKSWEENPDIGFVVMKGRGRAFCAGGDIVGLYNLINEGRIEDCKEFFRTAYSFIYLLGTYLKPNVALLDGITMGGGAGISIPGMFRVATDRTVFATPETLIGFHTDAGASFHLSHLPGYWGEYLALTGEKLNGSEMIACGLATHYAPSAKLPLIEEGLARLVTDDPSIIEASLEQYGSLIYPNSSGILQRIEILDKCFSYGTVEEIIDALSRGSSYQIARTHDSWCSSILKALQETLPEENETARTQDPWCSSTLKRLKEASPLSLKVCLRSIREGRFQTLDQCLIREYRMSVQGISRQISNDFCEGVRARMVEKDYAPKWNPPSLEQVSADMVEQYFLPISELEQELELPTTSREAFI